MIVAITSSIFSVDFSLSVFTLPAVSVRDGILTGVGEKRWHTSTINELVFQDAVVKAINQMLGDKSNYQTHLQLNIASVIRASQVTLVENIDEKLMALQQELVQKAQSKEAYDEIADEIFRLRELRQQTTVDTAARDKQIKRINDLQDCIAQQTTHLTEFDKSLVRRWIKQITI